jgi:hypothetical protein
MSLRVLCLVGFLASAVLLLEAGFYWVTLSTLAVMAPPVPQSPAEDVVNPSSRAAELRQRFCRDNRTAPWQFDYIPLAWRRAAHLLNDTASETAEAREPDERQRAALRDFYSFDPGAALFFPDRESATPTCAYLRTFKAGNNCMVKNMELWTRRREHIIRNRAGHSFPCNPCLLLESPADGPVRLRLQRDCV